MCKLFGVVLFSVGLGIVIALLIPETLAAVIGSAFCLLLGYHLFCSC